MNRLLSIIASRHRSAPLGLSQPVVLASGMWFQNVSPGDQPAARSWTTPANTDLLLCLAACQYVDAFGTPSWNGDAMTLIDTNVKGIQYVRAWVLENPYIGSASLAYSAFNWKLSGTFHPCLIALRSAKRTGITVVKGGGVQQASPVSTSAAPIAVSDLLCDIISRTDNDALIAAGSQTPLHDGGGRSRGAVSYRRPNDLSSLTFSWSWAGNGTEDTAHMILRIPGK